LRSVPVTDTTQAANNQVMLGGDPRNTNARSPLGSITINGVTKELADSPEFAINDDGQVLELEPSNRFGGISFTGQPTGINISTQTYFHGVNNTASFIQVVLNITGSTSGNIASLNCSWSMPGTAMREVATFSDQGVANRSLIPVTVTMARGQGGTYAASNVSAIFIKTSTNAGVIRFSSSIATGSAAGTPIILMLTIPVV
jgi:hypothetical protein